MSSTGVSGSIDWVRFADTALGLSALGWAVRALLEHGNEPVGWALALVNASAGVVFVLRRPAVRFCTPRDALLAFASVPLAGVAFRLAGPIAAWPRLAEGLFVAGAIAAAAAIATLGRSFGVLPAVRDTVARGPYRVVRHPIYAAELAMVAACCVAAPHPAAWLTFAATVALVGVRVILEERLLTATDAYRGYCARVRWRLVPGVW
jgi:protein-S-isoprenylcysteine O-methyltransferase Ste14